MAKPSLDDLLSQVRKEPGPSASQVAAEKKKKAAKEALKNVPVNKKRPVPNQASQQFVDKTNKEMKAGQKADAVSAKKENLAAKMERRKNLQRKKKELEKKKREGEERKARVNNALAQATSGPRASSGSSMETGGASADKAAVQSAGQAVSGVAKAVSAATGLDKKIERMRKNISNRLRPGRKKGLATGAASTGRNNMRPKSSKPADPWKSNKPKDPWKEEFSHWREEFIFEVDDKVPTKKEKTIQPMSGKNTIIINPDSMQESKKDDTYLETDMKKRKKNNEKAIADMKKVKDDTVPRWMREDSEFSDWRSEIDEGVGMTVAKVIDKTKPPLGRASIRRSVSSALKMREVDKETRRNRTRKFSGVAASERASKADKYVSPSSRTTAKEEKDHEVSMAQSQLSSVEKDVKALKKKLGKKEKNLPAWMQAKITDTEHNMDAAVGYATKEEVEHIEERSIQMQRRVDRYLGRDKAKAKERKDNVGRIRKGREEIASTIARLSNSPGGVPASVARQAEKVGVRKDHFKGAARAALKNSFEPEGEMTEATYPSDFKKGSGVAKKKDGRPQQHDQDTDRYGRRKTVDEGKKGLWDNIHARREAGKPKRKPGDKNYPKTLNVDEGVMPAAIDPAKHRAAQKATKIRNLMKGATTAGEKEAARRKTRGPSLAGEHYDWRQELGEGAAWTRKAGKSESGGLNEKGRKSYERENPGSDLKAPSKEPGNKRRSSFCARMKGMKKKLTSSKTARDPDSRINKSLRAWNC